METAKQTALMEQPEILELFRVLEGNGLEKEQKEVESLVKYLDGMEIQFGQVLEELRDVKEQLSQIQDSGVKASVLRITEQAGGKVQEAGEKIHTVRKNLIQSAKNAVQTFRGKGKDALRKAVSSMKIPSALARIQEGLHGAVECMNRQADKMAVLNSELHAAGDHIKNAGRIFRGKELEKVETQAVDKGITVSLFQVISHYAGAQKAEEEFTELAEIVEQTEDTPEEEPAGEEQEVVSPLERYAEMFAMNNDMVGWIRIGDTPINYPVMYTPDNPDYYLKHNFYKESSAYGVPYIAEHCDPMEPSDNVIIYGHHMNNGSMFAGLMNYEDRDFYEQHKTIRFDTLTETAEYEVIAVFKTTVYDDTGFKFYLFSHAETEKEFTDYVEQCSKLSLYDTGVTATYGDKLLTLSTCEYSNTNGRLVVVAKKI